MKTLTHEISFDVTRDDARLIHTIAIRAAAMAQRFGVEYSLMTADMDLTATHANGMPLRLAALLAADDGNFGHDIFGIRRHLDRKTGKLGGCFVPRFAV